MDLPNDFKELLELFNRHKVEYLIVGGYALAFYGAPRYTGDIDLYGGTRAFGPMLTMSRDRWM